MNYADLHIHSQYSDGTYSPAEIVRIAKASGVALISVCDHNLVRGTLETLPLAKEAGLNCIAGVEIDAIFEGLDIHLLCYGANFADEALMGRIRHARQALDGMSEELLRRMKADYPQLSMNEYAEFAHDCRLGGWKMLQYLRHCRITPDLKAGFSLYDRYDVRYAQAGFDDAQVIVDAVHSAGGRAILAHPAVVFPSERLDVLEKWVRRALELGLDGVECFYPKHSAGIARRMEEICMEKGLMTTAGSDCHGAFNHNCIGQTKTPVERLNLRGLI